MTIEDMAALAECSVRKSCDRMRTAPNVGALEREYGRAHSLVEYVMRSGVVCAERGMTLMHDVDRAYRSARNSVVAKISFPYGEGSRYSGNFGNCG